MAATSRASGVRQRHTVSINENPTVRAAQLHNDYWKPF
jgi:hypothetical protein